MSRSAETRARMEAEAQDALVILRPERELGRAVIVVVSDPGVSRRGGVKPHQLVTVRPGPDPIRAAFCEIDDRAVALHWCLHFRGVIDPVARAPSVALGGRALAVCGLGAPDSISRQ